MFYTLEEFFFCVCVFFLIEEARHCYLCWLVEMALQKFVSVKHALWFLARAASYRGADGFVIVVVAA